MQNPFVFGKAAEGVHFTDRKQDALRLSANLSHGINTVLISPRRWGKTSLVKKVIEDVSSDEIKVVFFKGKKVLCFDDILTKGFSYARFALQLEKLGAEILGGFFIGKTQFQM